MLNSNELQELYEGLKLNSVNKYDYVLTGKCPGELGAGPVGLDPVGLGLGEGPPRPPAPGLHPGPCLLRGQIGCAAENLVVP